MDPKFLAHWKSHRKAVNSKLETIEPSPSVDASELHIEVRTPKGYPKKLTPPRSSSPPSGDYEEEVIVQPPRRLIPFPPRPVNIPLPPDWLNNITIIGDALIAAGIPRSEFDQHLYYRLSDGPVVAFWKHDIVQGSMPFFTVQTANNWLRYHIEQPYYVQDYEDENEPMYFDDFEELMNHMLEIANQ